MEKFENSLLKQIRSGDYNGDPFTFGTKIEMCRQIAAGIFHRKSFIINVFKLDTIVVLEGLQN